MCVFGPLCFIWVYMHQRHRSQGHIYTQRNTTAKEHTFTQDMTKEHTHRLPPRQCPKNTQALKIII